ncbi:carboxypeptidase-like regulatory domain-containing protein [uncultured Winogradskyella sp.]|uniref:carboxypeptidase-like regulatory domain-containing protein n=1 Tax=uncultured Winogradskyella sp. TaxID=395353 RepID=UPI00262C52BD|nr:carboxypeptidase-like regulatory domain-containing protein [uncultured Winogradskyella sp.]
MKSQLELSVATPCSKKFSDFSPTKNGGFCDSCNKEVIDFTKMKDENIIKFFQTNTENTCGIFNSPQLKTYNTTKTQRQFSFIGTIAAACLALLSFGSIEAQTKTQSPKNTISQQTNTFTVKGNVSDGDLPLPGVNIILKGSKIGTQTDFDGNFTFPQKLKKGDVLLFSYIGMKSQKVVINDKNTASNVSLKLDMKLDQVIIMGKVSSKKVYKSRH